MIKLKRINKEDEYDLEVCAATRCKDATVITLALKDTKEYGLCEKHWQEYCKD